MRYSSGQAMAIGDEVKADGMSGVIVCDFDNRQFLIGYEDWDMPTVEMIGGGKLSSGVMVNTVEAGLVYYAEQDEDIQLIRANQNPLHSSTFPRT